MTDQPWDQQPGEPVRWYNRFDAFYRPQGPDRTLEEAWRGWARSQAKETNGVPLRYDEDVRDALSNDRAKDALEGCGDGCGKGCDG